MNSSPDLPPAPHKAFPAQKVASKRLNPREITGENGNSTPEKVEAAATGPDPPSWYHGTTPWSEVGPQERDVLKMIAEDRAEKAEALKALDHALTGNTADSGEALIVNACDKNGVNAFYKTPHMFGQRMVIWIPENDWDRFSVDEKSDVESYMSSRYTNWAIGVGRVRGGDILSDRLVVVR
jgi:hypothetical protein